MLFAEVMVGQLGQMALLLIGAVIGAFMGAAIACVVRENYHADWQDSAKWASRFHNRHVQLAKTLRERCERLAEDIIEEADQIGAGKEKDNEILK